MTPAKGLETAPFRSPWRGSQRTRNPDPPPGDLHVAVAVSVPWAAIGGSRRPRGATGPVLRQDLRHVLGGDARAHTHTGRGREQGVRAVLQGPRQGRVDHLRRDAPGAPPSESPSESPSELPSESRCESPSESLFGSPPESLCELPRPSRRPSRFPCPGLAESPIDPGGARCPPCREALAGGGGVRVARLRRVPRHGDQARGSTVTELWTGPEMTRIRVRDDSEGSTADGRMTQTEG